MKNMRRLASVLLAIVMVLAMTVTAFAASPYTITINNDEDGYVYTAYQIFAGDIAEEYTRYIGTSAPTDGTQLYTYDGVSTYTPAATYVAGTTYYYMVEVLTNITWGSGIDYTNTDLQDALTSTYSSTDAATIALELTTQARAEAFADIVGKYLTTGTNSTQGTNVYTIEVSDAGYYLIENTKVPDGYDAAYTNYIMQVVANVTVDPKSDVPSSDKTVGDINDSDDTKYTDGQTSADHDIGDDVPFILTATMPSNYGAYSQYKLVFHDTMDPSLTFDASSVEVSVGGIVVDPSCYTVLTYGYQAADNLTSFVAGTAYYTYDGSAFNQVTDTSSTPDPDTVYYTKGNDCYHEVSITSFATGTTYYTENSGVYTAVNTSLVTTPDPDTTYYVKGECTFEVKIANTKTLTENGTGYSIHVAAGSVITVTYTAELNNNAVIGEPGNWNESYISYSNNPTWDGNGTEPTGDTPPETVVVFTYELIVSKVNADGAPLEGAGFTLYKYDEVAGDYVAVGSEMTAGYQAVTITAFESGVTYYTYDATNGYVQVTSGAPVAGTTYYVKNQFTWTGLDDGEYMLVETTVPISYNKMGNLYFTVTAVHDADNGITSLVITDAQGQAFTGNLTFTATSSTGEISTAIQNGAGSTLPGTGGIGTTIFYIVGGVMVLGAAVVLITRKRMSRSK